MANRFLGEKKRKKREREREREIEIEIGAYDRDRKNSVYNVSMRVFIIF